jgi:hypothetical protein
MTLVVVLICFDDLSGHPRLCDMHPLKHHTQGFTQSHWMLPLGEHWRHITLAAAMVLMSCCACLWPIKHNLYSLW